MNIKLNAEKLNDILISFYEMNGIRVVIFDSEYNEIMSYPPQKCLFCRTIRSNPELNEFCIKSDFEAFNECTKKDDIYIYKCHAGLVEAVKPLIYEKRIIGYIMFGQITDIKDKSQLSVMINKYDSNCDISGIKYKSRKQIIAAAKILEICTEYIILKEMIALENNNLISSVKEYIKENLSADLTVDKICQHIGCGRTKIYKMFKEECGIGIAHYITEKRLSKARKLLKSTDLSISEISSRCGFCDYNYFSRIYKKAYGISPKSEQN